MFAQVPQNCGQIFRYAIATGRAERDPSPPLTCAVPSLRSSKPPAVITEPKAIGELLRAIDGYQGYLVTKCALRIAPLVFVRPGELRKAEWAEIDLDKPEKRPSRAAQSKKPGAGKPPRALPMTMAAMKGRSAAASSAMICSNACVT